MHYIFYINRLGNNLFKTDKIYCDQPCHCRMLAYHFKETYSAPEYYVFALLCDEQGKVIRHIDDFDAEFSVV